LDKSKVRKKSKRSGGDVNLQLCRSCYLGTCCREGVETDLFEAATILKLSLDIPKPWFQFKGRDKRSPSGFTFSTAVKHRRCIFQDENRRCRIYDVRPRYCREFPLEDGRKAPYYHQLCHFGFKKKARKR
jgi:Fe-S-cluster containining protein